MNNLWNKRSNVSKYIFDSEEKLLKINEKAEEDANKSLECIIETEGDNYYIIITNKNFWKYYDNKENNKIYHFWYLETFEKYYENNYFNDVFWYNDGI